MIDITGLREDKRPQSSTIVHALLDRLEAAEKDVALKERVIDSLGSELNAVTKERDELRYCFNEWATKTEWVQQGINEGTISAKYLGLHRADVMARLLSEAEKERDALRAKIETMERQEPAALVESWTNRLPNNC